jgi:hypothetical protein
MKERRLLYALGVLVAVAAAGAEDPSLVLNDGGIQFPDGTVQMTATVGRALVPDTGQTLCWDTDGDPRPCTGTGEDGEFQAGVAWPTPRFTDNGDGTVTDNLTGLIWLKDANCPAGSMNWQQALDWVTTFNGGSTACTDYTAGTFTNWVLPNVRELQSLVHYGVSFPSVPNTAGTGQWTEGDPFSGVQSAPYWSSTSIAGFTDDAWDVVLNAGGVDSDVKTDLFFVWPVGGGQ